MIGLSSEPAVRIHYLGHASFILQFDNGISVLTDYGDSCSYGLDSPVYSLGDFKPDFVTFSHSHPDHKRPDVQFGRARILTAMDSLSIEGLEIRPIRTSEASVDSADNTSYLFLYKGMKILHLADAQAYIEAIRTDGIREKVKVIYPETVDLLLMTIQGVHSFIPQAEEFIDLLQPKRVIPMHYWSPAYKEEFLGHCRAEYRKHYSITNIGSSDYDLSVGEEIYQLRIISLEPAIPSR